MKKVIANILTSIVVISGFFVIYYVFRAYFTFKIVDSVYYDGWGRKLYETPLWMKLLGQDFQFPGYKFFFLDFIGFWLYAAIFAALIKITSFLRGV